MSKPRTWMGICLLLLLGVTAGSAFGANRMEQIIAKYSAKEPQYYTAYNFFAERGHVYAINFQVGSLIPAGTPVRLHFVKDYSQNPGMDDPELNVEFTTLPDKATYTLRFNSRYHPGVTLYDYIERMFTDKTFADQTKGKAPEVIDAIRRGAVIPGMTKQEVILSYGYPAEHRTYSQRANTWTYWTTRRRSKNICFDLNEKAIPCSEQRSNDL